MRRAGDSVAGVGQRVLPYFIRVGLPATLKNPTGLYTHLLSGEQTKTRCSCDGHSGQKGLLP